MASNPPPLTRCHACGTQAAETICHVCKTPRRSAQELANDYANWAIKRDQEKPRWLRELQTGGRDKYHGIG